MTPWFIATEPFTPEHHAWSAYIRWSRLSQLKELVSLDPILCPPVLGEIKKDYWPHIVNDDFMLSFFLDFDFLMAEVAAIEKRNILCVIRNPKQEPSPPTAAGFDFLGYDLVDIQHSASALTNCGGFRDIFADSELSSVGLLTDFKRALEVQHALRTLHPEEPHANCHLWAIFRAKD